MSQLETENYVAFRDCLFAVVVEKASPERNKSTSKRRHSQPQSKHSTVTGSNSQTKSANALDDLSADAADLADFSEYMAAEIFPNLPVELQTLSYQTSQNDPNISETWSLPLTLTATEEVSSVLPPSVNDNLTTYKLVDPPQTDVQSFMSTVLSAFIAAVTVPPPKWIATKTSACEICDRDWVPLTYHHLIPKQVHAKVLKRGWHDESQLNSVAWLCRACHSFVHKMASNEELAKEWYTVDKICSRDDVQKWAQWVQRVRWKKS